MDRKIQGTPSSASKDTPREKFWELVGGAEQRSAYEAAVVAHEEEEVRTVRSTVPRGVYIHRKVGEMEEME